jgi:hypothetical protein
MGIDTNDPKIGLGRAAGYDAGRQARPGCGNQNLSFVIKGRINKTSRK